MYKEACCSRSGGREIPGQGAGVWKVRSCCQQPLLVKSLNCHADSTLMTSSNLDELPEGMLVATIICGQHQTARLVENTGHRQKQACVQMYVGNT